MHCKKHGFTIIEVSLVLAIAGLILVMAFIALPALQRQTRDSQRKEDTMTFLQALKKYQQNNRGQLPDSDFFSDGEGANSITRDNYGGIGCTWEEVENKNGCEDDPWSKFYTNYLGDSFTNPEGEKYTFLLLDASKANQSNFFYDYSKISSLSAADADRDADLFIYIGARCNGNEKPQSSSNSRNVAIVTPLESGIYCADI